MPHVKSLEAGNIFAQIDARPPLMRQAAARTYIGSEVDWPMIYRDGYELSSGWVRLLFTPERKSLQMIAGTAALSDYPQLKRLQVGAAVRVCGTISKVEALQIELDIRRLTFL